MPFPYHNVTPPTPNSKNTINSIAVDFGIRDFLLNKNLTPQYPQISTSLNGSPKIGQPVLDTVVGTGNVVQPFGLPLETEGLLRKDISTLPNRFKNSSSMANTLTNIEFIQPTLDNFPNSTFPNGIDSYPTGANPAVFQYGIMGKTLEGGYLKKATLRNLYLDNTKQVDAADWITLETVPTNQQIKGYLDVYGGLNIGDSPAIQASSVIGSVLNGQGLGLAKGGVVTNFDLRASLAGRVLGAAGLITDTKLGMIGGQQLALALANNAAFNLEQSLLGKLNVQDNVLSLVKNGTLAGFRPNYQITVPSGTVGKALDYTARILGFTLPKSNLADAGSIFLSESNAANIERANSMILNTGKGQVVALINNMNANLIGTTQNDNPDTTTFRTGYAPGFKDNQGQKAINPNLYAFYNSDESTILNFLTNKSVIPEISYNRSGMIQQYGFTGPEDNVGSVNPYADSTIKKPTFTWGSSIGNGVNNVQGAEQFASAFKKKSLLAKTQLLFNDIGMKNIVSSKGQMNLTPSQIQTAVVGFGISKGNAVMSSANFDLDSGRYIGVSAKTADETYCRSWTTLSRYEKVQNLVRSSGLSSIVPYRNQMNGSILDEFGIPKIAPYSTDNPADPKKFMFSIENLAWADSTQNLLACEVGPGDLITGKKGRIMWFPPYNIQFSENSSVSWESNNFIGRGESVYTYNNTERSGTLSFQIIVDHPSYINSFRGSDGPDDHYVSSFFAGCVEPNSKFSDKLTVSEISSIASDNVTKPQTKTVTPQTPLQDITVYYPNDVAVLPSVYENGLSGATTANTIDYSVYTSGFGLGVYPGSFTSSGPWNDNHNFGLNSGRGSGSPILIDGVSYDGFLDPALITFVNEYLNTKCPACVVEVAGYASAQGNASVNQKLADARADNLITSLKPQWHTNFNGPDKDKRFKKMPSKQLTGTNCIAKSGADTDTLACKQDRKAVIHFRFDETLLPKEEVGAEPVIAPPQRNISTKIINRLYTECNYFEQLTDNDYFVFDKFRDKIKYFHPAFHSTTPEGLNSRLTFLQQCTRQGPTLEGQGANNLAFGRPPVCILRIGDFYNTKIIIDNISIDYEPLVWDLNPEGIGVQPMIANVNMSFKFVGGSTLLGPINKLQNALSFNYYANAQVYDPRADYIARDASRDTKNSDGTTVPGYSIISGATNVNTLIETVVTKGSLVSNTPIQDQTAANDNATSGTEKQEQKQDANTPKITGFDHVEINGWGDDPNAYTVQVSLKQQGIFSASNNTNTQLLTDDEFKAFVDKGIRLTLDRVPNPISNSRAEEIVPFTGPSGKNAKDWLFGLGVFMGSDTSQGQNRVKFLITGDYMLSVHYNGQKVASLAVKVSGERFQHFG